MRKLALLALAVLVSASCQNIPGLGQQVCPNRWFDEADTDRSRTVTREEYDRWRATCTGCEAWAGWFATGDVNGDGEVTLGETCAIRGVPLPAASPSAAP